MSQSTTTRTDYEAYLALRERLAASMDRLGSELTALGAPERAKRLASARESLLSDAFKLMVVGEFKRGKSTLINAMLGRDVLPARVAPCTAVITEVAHGPEAIATLWPIDETAEPLTVPVEKLRDYITVQQDEDDDEDAAPSPWRKLDVRYPLELLRRNVVLVDSPGLNEHLTRTRLALDYLAGADAVLVVLSCQQALSASELAFIDQELAGRNLRHVFFVWNHADALEGDAEGQQALEALTASELLPRVGTGARIHRLSAREALVARKNDQPLPAPFAAFESALEHFLVSERGRVKLLAPLRTAEAMAQDALSRLLGERLALSTTSLQALELRQAAEAPRLEALEARRERLIATVERRREVLVKEAVASYQAFAAESSIAAREALATVDVSALEAVLSRSRSHQRLGTHLEGWFKARVETWQTETLAPLVERHVADLTRELDEQAQGFMQDVAAARAALMPEVAVHAGVSSDVAAADRLLSAVGGFFVGGIGAAIEGASVGFAGMSRGLIFHIGLSAGLVALGVGMPVMLPLLAAVGIGRTVWEAQSSVEKLRERVAREVGAQLSASVPQVASGLSDRLTGEFDRLIAALDAGMRVAMEEAVGQVQALIAARREGEAAAKAEAEAASEARTRLEGVQRELQTLRFELEVAAGALEATAP